MTPAESARLKLLTQLAAGPIPSRAIVAAGVAVGEAADGLVDEGIAEVALIFNLATGGSSRKLRLTAIGKAAVRNCPAGVP